MEKTNNEKTKKIVGIIVNTVIWIIVVFSLLITVLVFSAQGNEDGVPSIFGKSLVTIESNSMEPTYKTGTMVFMTKISDEEKMNLQPGTIITYRAPIDINNNGIVGDDLNTHRIVSVDVNTKTVKTQGDNKVTNPTEDNYTVSFNDIIGTCTEKGKLGGVGNVIDFLRSSLGFFLCIVLPLILFFLYELYNFITILVTERQKKAMAGAPVIDEEEIKRRAIEEYLAQQKDEEEIKRRAIEEYLANEASADKSDEK